MQKKFKLKLIKKYDVVNATFKRAEYFVNVSYDSLGFFDDRTGLSLIGYTYNLRQTDKNEIFVGGGTALFAFTATIGWKHYYRKSKLSISSIFYNRSLLSAFRTSG